MASLRYVYIDRKKKTYSVLRSGDYGVARGGDSGVYKTIFCEDSYVGVPGGMGLNDKTVRFGNLAKGRKWAKKKLCDCPGLSLSPPPGWGTIYRYWHGHFLTTENFWKRLKKYLKKEREIEESVERKR